MRISTGLFYFFAFLSSVSVFGQTQAQLDSMERLIPLKKGKEKVLLLNDLTFYYFQSNTDKAIRFGEQSLELAKTLKDKKLLANTYNDFSMPCMTKGNYKKAIELNLKSLAIRLKIRLESCRRMENWGRVILN
jgi:tetratricopeptide (TPR) repeat protein